MADVKLYTEDEDVTYTSKCVQNSGREIEVEIVASTQDGAFDRVTESAQDYNIKRVGKPEKTGHFPGWG